MINTIYKKSPYGRLDEYVVNQNYRRVTRRKGRSRGQSQFGERRKTSGRGEIGLQEKKETRFSVQVGEKGGKEGNRRVGGRVETHSRRKREWGTEERLQDDTV